MLFNTEIPEKNINDLKELAKKIVAQYGTDETVLMQTLNPDFGLETQKHIVKNILYFAAME
jgi:hypothetical protein